MLMKKNILHILGIFVLAVSCIAEQNFDVSTSSKDEVEFFAGMRGEVLTRTLYGADHPSTIKVKWVDNDTIMVFGTTCIAPTTNGAMYVISEKGDNAPNVTEKLEDIENNNRSEADGLQKIGEMGVQWNADASDFVALYPASKAKFKLEDGGVVRATTSISSVQNYVFDENPSDKTDANGTVYNDSEGNALKVWKGTHFANNAANPTMQNAIMYARTDGVVKGDPVSLSFEPFSTVLRFRFEGFSSLWETGSETLKPKVSISSVTLTAPYSIAGDFDILIPPVDDISDKNPVAAVSNGAGSNTITINTIKSNGSFLEITTNEAVEFNVFTVPYSGKKIEGGENPWTVTIKVEGVGTFTYKMIPKDGAVYTLTPGLIHKVKIPSMVSNTPPTWQPENWITQIPPPVYISELSIPGAWYCFDNGYQKTTDLATLYSNGIRAFNLDCRISKKNCNDGRSYLFGAIKTEAIWKDSDYPSKAYLACAGSESIEKIIGDLELGVGENQPLEEGVYVLNAFGDIVELAQQHKDEYVVVVFSFAEKPFTNSETAFGSVNPVWIMAEIKKVLATYSDYIYTDLNRNTTIKDILDSGKNVIVKINHCTDNFYVNDSYLKFDDDSNPSTDPISVIPNGVMGSFASMSSNSSYNAQSDIITNIAGLHNEEVYQDYFTTMRFNDIYNGTTKSDLIYCYHQAQHTTSNMTRGQKGKGNPSLGMRMDAIDDIIKQSKSVYDDALHNHWFQMGIGGSLNGDNPEGVSEALNPYLYGKIVEKMNTDPSPVGVVLMNHATSTSTYTVTTTDVNNQTVTYSASSQDLVKAIIEMNGKFYLNRRGNDVITGDGTQAQELDTKAAAYVGPDAF